MVTAAMAEAKSAAEARTKAVFRTLVAHHLADPGRFRMLLISGSSSSRTNRCPTGR